MKPLEKFNKLIMIMTIVSFVIGTLFITSFAIIQDFEIAVAGYFYLWIAFAVNIIAFIARIVHVLIKKQHQLQTLKVLGI